MPTHFTMPPGLPECSGTIVLGVSPNRGALARMARQRCSSAPDARNVSRPFGYRRGRSRPNRRNERAVSAVDRTELAVALAHAKAIRATVVFAKLDRLTRNVDLLRSLVVCGVDLVFCDLRTCLPAPWGASCSS